MNWSVLAAVGETVGAVSVAVVATQAVAVVASDDNLRKY